MVEHLYSFPHAVPSSICHDEYQPTCPPKLVQLLLRATHIVASEVVDVGLRQHRIVLKLALAQWRRVAGNDDELGLA